MKIVAFYLTSCVLFSVGGLLDVSAHHFHYFRRLAQKTHSDNFALRRKDMHYIFLFHKCYAYKLHACVCVCQEKSAGLFSARILHMRLSRTYA